MPRKSRFSSIHPLRPPLAVVSSRRPDPPPSLGEAGRNFWNQVQEEYAVTDIGGVVMLEQACAALDQIEVLKQAIERDGVTIQTRNGIQSNPAVRQELAYRAFVTRTVVKLGLNYETPRW